MKHTITVPCDRCHGEGHFWEAEGEAPVPCGSCQGQGHVEVDAVPLTPNEAFVYVCAVRYALNRQTYAGGIVIEALTAVVDRMPYQDRKLLEREIADALFRHEVDTVHRTAWQGVVDRLRAINAEAS